MRTRKIRYNWLFVLIAFLLVCLVWGFEINDHALKDSAEAALKVTIACYCVATLAFHLMPLAEANARKFWFAMVEIFVGLTAIVFFFGASALFVFWLI